MDLPDYLWMALSVVLILLAIAAAMVLAGRRKRRIMLETPLRSGLIYCSGFGLRFSTWFSGHPIASRALPERMIIRIAHARRAGDEINPPLDGQPLTKPYQTSLQYGNRDEVWQREMEKILVGHRNFCL